MTDKPAVSQPKSAIVDMQVGFKGKDEDRQLLFFFKNLTDQARAANLIEADNIIGRRSGSFDRWFKRYGGVTLGASL